MRSVSNGSRQSMDPEQPVSVHSPQDVSTMVDDTAPVTVLCKKPHVPPPKVNGALDSWTERLCVSHQYDPADAQGVKFLRCNAQGAAEIEQILDFIDQ